MLSSYACLVVTMWKMTRAILCAAAVMALAGPNLALMRRKYSPIGLWLACSVCAAVRSARASLGFPFDAPPRHLSVGAVVRVQHDDPGVGDQRGRELFLARLQQLRFAGAMDDASVAAFELAFDEPADRPRIDRKSTR